MQNRIVIGILLGIILVLGIILITRKPETQYIEFDPTPFIDSIKQANSEVVYWQNYAADLEYSLEISSQKQIEIRYVYKPIYKFTHSADVRQLDSTLWANIP